MTIQGKKSSKTFLSLPTPLSAKHGHSLCARMNQRVVCAQDLRRNKLALSTRRVRSSCYYHDRADCEAEATDANRAAEAFRRSHESTGSVCTGFAKKQTCTIYPARSLKLLLSRPSGLRSRSDRREQVRGDTPPHRSNRWVVCVQFAKGVCKKTI